MASCTTVIEDSPTEVKLSSGRTIPSMGFGVYKVDPSATKEIVYNALHTGYRLIDTAARYKNEKATGEAISEFLKDYPDVKRSDIFYTTKIFGANYSYDIAYELICESFHRVQQLGYIDLLLVHLPSGSPETRLNTYRALLGAQKEGLVKDIGVSNYGIHHLQEIIDAKLPLPVVNQIELSPWLQRKELVNFLRTHGIAFEAWGPLTRGTRLTEESSLNELARRYNKTSAQVLLRWSLDFGAIPLAKTTSRQRMEENINVSDFRLTEHELTELGDPNEHYLSNDFDPASWPSVYDPYSGDK